LSDLEGLTRNLIKKGYSERKILKRIVQEYQDFKAIDDISALNYAKAILEECHKSDISRVSNQFIRELLDINNANVSFGKKGMAY